MEKAFIWGRPPFLFVCLFRRFSNKFTLSNLNLNKKSMIHINSDMKYFIKRLMTVGSFQRYNVQGCFLGTEGIMVWSNKHNRDWELRLPLIEYNIGGIAWEEGLTLVRWFFRKRLPRSELIFGAILLTRKKNWANFGLAYSKKNPKTGSGCPLIFEEAWRKGSIPKCGHLPSIWTLQSDGIT